MIYAIRNHQATGRDTYHHRQRAAPAGRHPQRRRHAHAAATDERDRGQPRSAPAFVDALAPAIEVMRFDVPGTGGSPAPHIPYRFPILARLVTEMLDQLGYQQVDVLGVSWGGALAQQFAFQYPVRWRRLILVSTGTGALMIPGNLSALVKIATPRRYQDPVYMEQNAGGIYGGKVRTQPELAHEFARTARLGSVLGYFYQMLGAVGWTSVPWLRTLRQPTLILHGDDDPLVPLVNAKIMQRLIRMIQRWQKERKVSCQAIARSIELGSPMERQI